MQHAADDYATATGTRANVTEDWDSTRPQAGATLHFTPEKEKKKTNLDGVK